MTGPTMCQNCEGGVSQGVLRLRDWSGVLGTNLFLEFVGAPCYEDGEDAGEDPWRGAHKEGTGCVEAEGGSEGRL